MGSLSEFYVSIPTCSVALGARACRLLLPECLESGPS